MCSVQGLLSVCLSVSLSVVKLMEDFGLSDAVSPRHDLLNWQFGPLRVEPITVLFKN
jgi:hypothetical protein